MKLTPQLKAQIRKIMRQRSPYFLAELQAKIKESKNKEKWQ